MKERLIWIDWMKVIGIFLIVLGHTFPTGNQYIYIHFLFQSFFLSQVF
jgi:fucose 4-O-acetylase-like acetyltransferase